MAEAEFNYTPAFKAAWERIQERIKQEIAIAVDKLGAEDPETMDAIISSVFREEMQKLGQIERIKNLYKIRDKHTQQFTQFVPNKHQLDVLEGGRSRVAILKSRQVGYTTFACVYALDKALFEYWNTGIMSHSQKHVAKIFDIVRHTYSYFVRDWGDYYKPQEAFNNANELAWEDTKASVSVAMDFQGRTVKLLHCSEAHFIPTDRIVNSLQAVPDSGEIFLETTPNGRGGYFFKVWQDYEKHGDSAAYKGIFVPWFEHYPENPEKFIPPPNTKWDADELELKARFNLEDYHLWWRRRILVEKCDNNKNYFDTHYPSDVESCWLAGALKVFKPETLKLQQRFVKEPNRIGTLESDGKKVKFTDDAAGWWKIYQLPQVNHSYSLGVDSSTGSGHDPSVIIIIDNETGEQTAKFSGFLDAESLSDEMFKAAQLYNKGFINPEINEATGLAALTLLKQKYFNIYKRQEFDSANKTYTSKLGFYTSSVTKNFILANLNIALKEGRIKVRDQQTFDELTTFIHVVDKKPDGRLVVTAKKQAEVGCFDDEVIALALALEMQRARPQEDITEHRVVSNRQEKGIEYVEIDNFLL